MSQLRHDAETLSKLLHCDAKNSQLEIHDEDIMSTNSIRRVEFLGQSNTGLRRLDNEDSFRIERDLGMCLVADGVGGAAAGELASRLFSDAAFEVFRNAKHQIENHVVDRVQEAFRLANQRILQHAQQNPAHKGLACTAELMAFSDEGFVVGHLGDSRTYRFRNGQLKQLTKDHSLVQAQIDQGIITPEAALSHPWRNVILRAVGMDEDLALDLVRGRIYPQDQFLLCSDGLTDMVPDELIRQTLQASKVLEQKLDELIEMALKAGGTDNITVVMLSIS
jgi:PPM family protein phosphatase